MKKQPLSVRVRKYLMKHPKATGTEVANATGAKPAYIYVIKSEMKKHRINFMQAAAIIKHGSKAKEANTDKVHEERDVPQITHSQPADAASNPPDNVNHPAHYKVGGMETIDFIEAKSLNYHLGNVVKYITRADHKGDKAEDLKKARWYLNREIAKLDQAKA